MTKALLSVVAAGPQISVQDAGRLGLMRFGVPRSGPMDRLSFAAANLALGNPIDAPALEVSLAGVTLKCLSGSVSFAVAGGDFLVDHAGTKQGSWTVATLEEGETLAIRAGPGGSWCYLAFAGRLEAESWLGSVSTHAISGFGGGMVRSGQELRIADADRREEREGDIKRAPSRLPRGVARVVLGPQQRFFRSEDLALFGTGPWKMTEAWDRMGVRLSGPSIPPNAALTMPSEPILRGSVQVSGDGIASILLADHQTTGGYPKIATVLDCDLDALVQLRPQDPVMFQPVTPAEAIAAARAAAAEVALYHKGLAEVRGTLAQRLMSENLIDGTIDAISGRRLE